MKRRDLEKHLRQHGCALKRHGGNHDYWHNPVRKKETAVGRHRDIPLGTARAICKALMIPIIEKR